MNVANFYNNIPFQLLTNANLPSNYCDLNIDQQNLFLFLLKEHIRLASTNRRLEKELDNFESELEIYISQSE